MTVKKILSVVLSALVLMASMFTVGAAAAAPTIEVTVSDYDIQAKVTSDVSGRMTAQLINAAGDQLFGIETLNVTTATDGSYIYIFNFRMGDIVTSGPYKVVVGNNVPKTEQAFSYTNIAELGQKIAFYDNLDITAASGISAFFITNASILPVDLTSYNAITKERVKNIANSIIADDDFATGLNPSDTNAIKIARINDLDAKLAALISSIADVAKLDDSTKENWVNTVIPDAIANHSFDNKYYRLPTAVEVINGDERSVTLAYDAVYDLYMHEVEKIDTVAEFVPAEYKKMFDKATLVAVSRSWSHNMLKEAFLYYEGIGSITPNMTKINTLKDNDDYWSQLSQMANVDCDALVSNAVSLANTFGTTTGGGGGGGTGGGGGGGGLGGSKPVDKPTAPDKGTDIIPGSGNQASTVTSFADLTQAEWSREAVEYLAKAGVLSGKSAGTFAPNDNVKREEGAKIITGAFDIVEDGAACDFADVEADRWSYKYIASAVRLGIIKGDGADFRPASSMTREEMATILYRMFDLLGVEVEGKAMKFTDDGSISSWAKEAVSTLSGAGVINGMGDGTFAPKAPVTRAQLAKVTYEIMKLVGSVQ